MISILGDEPFSAIGKALGDTFEGLAFSQVFDSRELTSPPNVSATCLTTQIELPEPVGLLVTTLLTRSHLENLLQTVMPGFESCSEEMLLDFAHEVTNTAAGHLNTLLSPVKLDMKIGLPQTLSGEEMDSAIKPSESNRVFWFQVEDFEMWVGLRQSLT